MSVKPIPEGYHSVTPYMIIEGAQAAIDWYKKIFAAEEHLKLDGPGGSVAHAEIKIGDSYVMLADECPEMGFHGPKHYEGAATHLMIYLEDVDSTFHAAVEAGAEVVRPLQDQFYGDRSGAIKDPFGHQWTLATHIKDIPTDEVQRLADEMFEDS